MCIDVVYYGRYVVLVIWFYVVYIMAETLTANFDSGDVRKKG